MSTGQDEHFVALGNKPLKHPVCLRFIPLAHPSYPTLPSEVYRTGSVATGTQEVDIKVRETCVGEYSTLWPIDGLRDILTDSLS